MADWTKGQPAYQQVADQLRARIRSGDLAEGDQLPSYGEIMRAYDVSVTVARAAVGQLRSEGLVATHQGKGAFVLAGASKVQMPRDDELAALRVELQALTERVTQLEQRIG